MAKKKFFWCAFVLCAEPVNGQTVSSFLSFEADNKFYAVRAIEGMLPDNPKWVGEDGKLRPYRVLALHQCRPDETLELAHEYTMRFKVAAGMVGRDEEVGEEWQSYP